MSRPASPFLKGAIRLSRSCLAAALAQQMSRELLTAGVYVKGLWYPVVPKGEARLRVQISAAHTAADIDAAIASFVQVGQRLGVIR